MSEIGKPTVFDHDVVNPSTGLTGREKKLVLNSWASANKEPTALGITLLTCYFERHPEYQKFFRAFDNVPLHHLHKNKAFRSHAESVIAGLQSVFDALDDIALLEKTLVSVGERHRISGQKPQHFLDLQQVVLDVFRNALGDQFTSEVENAWLKTFNAVYLHVFKGLETEKKDIATTK